MSDGGGIDVFALALKLTTEGAEQMESALENIDAKGQGAAASLGTIAGVVGAAAAAFVLLEKASEFLKDAVAHAAEEEQVFTRMGVAVTNAGQSFDAARPQIEQTLEALSEKSTFRVDQLGGAFTRLVQLTGNTGGSLQKLGIVADFAAGRNIDLETAANLVGRAMNGNATQLNRMLGLHGDAAQAMAVLTERYHGNAEALANTMGGAQDQANNQMHELMESIGGIIAKEGGLEDATTSWRDVLKDATKWVEAHRTEIGHVVKAFISLAEAIGEIVMVAIYTLRDAWDALLVVTYIVISVVESIGPSFKLMASEVVLGAANLLSGLANIIPGAHAILDGVVKKLTTTAKQMYLESSNAIQDNTDAMVENINALKRADPEIEEHIKKVKDLDKAHKESTEDLEKELEALTKLAEYRVLTGPQFLKEIADYAELQHRIETTKMSFEELAKARETLAKAAKQSPILLGPQMMGMGDAGTSTDEELKRLNTKIVAGLVAGEKSDKKALHDRAVAFKASAEGAWFDASTSLAQSIQQNVMTDFVNLGTNIASTITDTIGAAFEGGFKNAGQTAAKALGGIMTMMGKHLIMASAPMKALEAAVKSNPIFSGGAMLAAGVILLALGSALGAAMGGSSAGGGGGGGGGYSVAGAGTATNAAQITNITLAANNSAAGASVRPAVPMHITVIGPNDPTVHGPIIDLINNATGRGYALNK